MTDRQEDMSADDLAMWEEAAKDLLPPKTLAKVVERHQFVITTVSTVGTLLAGLGGVTAAITITRTTHYSQPFDSFPAIPFVPVSALLVSVLAGAAVIVSLAARRPKFTLLNTHNAYEVRDYYTTQIEHSTRILPAAYGLLLAAALLATITSGITGVVAISDPSGGPAADPRNLASLTTSVGAGGAVTATLAGAVDRVQEGHHVRVQITSDIAQAPLADLMVYPDGDGKASLAAETQVPVGTNNVKAVITVSDETGTQLGEKFTLRADYPAVPEPTATAAATENATASP